MLFLCCLSLPTDIFGFLHLDFIMVKKKWQACWMASAKDQTMLETRSCTCPGNPDLALGLLRDRVFALHPWALEVCGYGLRPLLQTQHTHWFEVTAASDFNFRFFVGCHPEEFPCCVERWCRSSEGHRIWKGLKEVTSVLWLSLCSEWPGTPELRIHLGLVLASGLFIGERWQRGDLCPDSLHRTCGFSWQPFL